MKKGVLMGFLALQGGSLSGISFKAHLPSEWYPKSPKALKALLKDLDGSVGGALVGKEKGSKGRHQGAIMALIMPHAGYRYSGSVAASGYRLLDKKRIKRVLILAPSHSSAFKGVALPFFDTYQTPLGNIEVDMRCVQKLAKNKFFMVRKDVWSKEHSLEVQLPFIQEYLGSEVSIIPLIVGVADQEQLAIIAMMLKQCIDEHTLVVVSSDFTHHGIQFGYTPFSKDIDVQKSIAISDRHIIDAIIHKKSHAVAALIKQTGATICGRTPIILFKLLQEKRAWPWLQSELRGELIDYKTSYDVTHGNPADSVSYAAIAFKKP